MCRHALKRLFNVQVQMLVNATFMRIIPLLARVLLPSLQQLALCSTVVYMPKNSLAITCIPTIHDMRNLFARLVASSLSLSLSLVCQWRNGATGQAPNRNTPSHTFTLYNCLGLMMLLQLTSSFA